MTHFGYLFPLLLAGSGALAAGSADPRAPADPGAMLRLLTPRAAAPHEMPPLSDAYRCEPVLRIEEGTPASFGPLGDGAGREGRVTRRLCEA